MSQILPSNVSQQAFLAAECIIIIVPGVFVALRLWNNYGLNRRLLIDDYLAVVALCLLITTDVFYYEEIIKLNDPTTTLKWIGNVITASSFIAIFGAYCAKAPILIVYVRIFGVKKWLRYTCYAVLFADFLFALGPAIYLTVICQPNDRTLDPAWLNKCINDGLAVGFWNGCVAVLTDLIIFSLPLPVIAKLHVSKSRKIGLAAVFITGFLGLVASSVTLYYRGTSLTGKGTSANEVGQMLGQSIELSVAIIVGCVPAIRAFWVSRVMTTPLYGRLLSTFSATRSRRTQTRPTPASKDTRSARSGASSENMVPDEHEYVELGNAKGAMATHGGVDVPNSHHQV